MATIIRKIFDKSFIFLLDFFLLKIGVRSLAFSFKSGLSCGNGNTDDPTSGTPSHPHTFTLELPVHHLPSWILPPARRLSQLPWPQSAEDPTGLLRENFSWLRPSVAGP
jgi:hypothetical protein